MSYHLYFVLTGKFCCLINQLTSTFILLPSKWYHFSQFFFLYSSQYFQRAVTQLDVERNSLDQKLSDDINNKDLVELSNIEKSLVYLSSSIQTDLIMLHGLNHSKLDFTKEASERLDDVLIESSQSAEMVQISQQVTKTISYQ